MSCRCQWGSTVKCRFCESLGMTFYSHTKKEQHVLRRAKRGRNVQQRVQQHKVFFCCCCFYFTTVPSSFIPAKHRLHRLGWRVTQPRSEQNRLTTCSDGRPAGLKMQVPKKTGLLQVRRGKKIRFQRRKRSGVRESVALTTTRWCRGKTSSHTPHLAN